jgi:Tfp pilus assembly protein PilO
MSHTPQKAGPRQLVLEQLRHPIKLRLVLSCGIILAWYILFCNPLSELVSATTAQVDRERKRLSTAKEIKELRKSLVPYQGCIPAEADTNELLNRLIDHVRSTPLRLLDLKPETPKDLGPFDALGLQLTLEGHFADLDAFLGWIETERRLLRIDSIKVDPNNQDPSQLKAQIILVSLAEKPAAAAKTKQEARKGK